MKKQKILKKALDENNVSKKFLKELSEHFEEKYGRKPKKSSKKSIN